MKAAFLGTGSSVPPLVYNNTQICDFLQETKFTPEKIEGLLGVKERRFLVPLDAKSGLPDAVPDEIGMAAEAATRAMDMAKLDPKQIDLLILVSCTAQNRANRHFMSAAFKLHHRLNLSPNARVHEMDAGCGGFVHALEQAEEAILSGRRKHVLIVASSAPSQYMNRELYRRVERAILSPILFGDGAGAVVLGRSDNGRGLISTNTFVDSGKPLMDMRGAETDPELAYWIDSHAVRDGFSVYVRQALQNLYAANEESKNPDIYLFHQVNAVVLRKFLKKEGIDPAKVPINVDRYGNMAAAATPVLLDEAVRNQQVTAGTRIVFGVVGAGAQAGAIYSIF